MKITAFIPARGKSKRIPGKNIRILNGHPLIAYAIQSAKDAGIFNGIYVSSDSDEIGKIGEYYGAVWIKRPDEFSTDTSPDVEWITHALDDINPCDTFTILRPTSPFRTGQTIKRAWKEWNRREYCMKAVEKVSQHPSKMWIMIPSKELMHHPEFSNNHLLPIQMLPEIYVQNACIEIRPIELMNGKAQYYQPFFTKGYEGFDLNSPEDWILAEALIEKGLAKLTQIEKEPYETTL